MFGSTLYIIIHYVMTHYTACLCQLLHACNYQIRVTFTILLRLVVTTGCCNQHVSMAITGISSSDVIMVWCN